MLAYDFQSSVGYWIHCAWQAYNRAITEELQPQGITFRQCQVLCWLAERGAMSQIELAEEMSIEPATLVGVLDRMQRDGLIVREDDRQDRRRKIIRPQPKAEAVWKKIVASAERARMRASQGLTEEQLATLRELLGTVTVNLGAGCPTSTPTAEPGKRDG